MMSTRASILTAIDDRFRANGMGTVRQTGRVANTAGCRRSRVQGSDGMKPEVDSGKRHIRRRMWGLGYERRRSLEHFGPTLHFEGIWTSCSNIQLSGKRASKRKATWAGTTGRDRERQVHLVEWCGLWTFGESIPDYLVLVSIACSVVSRLPGCKTWRWRLALRGQSCVGGFAQRCPASRLVPNDLGGCRWLV